MATSVGVITCIFLHLFSVYKFSLGDMFIRFFVLLLTFSVFHSVSAKPVFMGKQKEELITELGFTASADEFRVIKDSRAQWKKVANKHNVNLGFSPHSYWFKVDLINDTGYADWFLTLDNTRLDYVDFHLVRGNQVVTFLAGDHRALKGHHSAYPTFNFSLPSGKSATLYFRVQSSAQITFNPVIRNSLQFGGYQAKRDVVHGVYLLVFILFVVCQLTLTQGNLSKMTLYYSACLFFGFAYLFFYYGDGNLLIWPNSLLLKNRMQSFFASSCLLCFSVFIQQYLRSKILQPRLHRFINIYLFFGVSCTLSMLLPIHQIFRVILVLIEVYVVITFTLLGVVNNLKLGASWVIGLTIPLLCTVAAMIIYASTFLGLLPHTEFTSKILLWSLPLDVLMLTMSFFFRHISLQGEHQSLMARLHELSKPDEARANTRAEIDNIDSITIEGKKSRLGNLDANDILGKLIQYLDTERAYLEPGLTLENVAMSLGVRPDQLSTIVNSQLQVSFSTLLNMKRLEEASDLLKSQPNITMLDIALQCGFGSKSNFNRLFKQQFNTTPSQYRKGLNMNET